MQAALEHLRAAKGELEKADEDKGGHRVKAVGLVDDAISQVEKGIEFDRRHERGVLLSLGFQLRLKPQASHQIPQHHRNLAG